MIKFELSAPKGVFGARARGFEVVITTSSPYYYYVDRGRGPLRPRGGTARVSVQAGGLLSALKKGPSKAKVLKLILKRGKTIFRAYAGPARAQHIGARVAEAMQGEASVLNLKSRNLFEEATAREMLNTLIRRALLHFKKLTPKGPTGRLRQSYTAKEV